MAIYIDYLTKVIHVPKSDTVLIQASPTEIRELDLNWFRLTLKDLEDDSKGMPFIDTHTHNTTVDVGGVTLARVVSIINGYTVTFEDGQYAVNLIGANSNVGDVVNVNQVSVRSANSAGLVTSAAIEYGEYGGEVTVDVINGESGTIYPIGTLRRRSNNIPDAMIIANARGFGRIKVIGDLTLVDGDDVRDMDMVGISHINSSLHIEPLALCENTSFSSFYLTGTLDGNSEIRDCVINGLEYFNGHIHDSGLAGTIYFNGDIQGTIHNCYTADMGNPPVFDFTDSDQDVMIPSYEGFLIIHNMIEDFQQIGIGLVAGEIKIDSSCTSGLLVVSGVGNVENISTGTYVIDTTVDGHDITNLSRLIELQRPHHTGTGDSYYWDPIYGDDARSGDHPTTAVKTFAQAHTLAQDGHHDIIVCMGSQAGQTVTNEIINITHNYLFLRGPGRDFKIFNDSDDSSPAITITGTGVEVSSVVVETNPTNTESIIKITGEFPLLLDLYLEKSANGINCVGAKYGIIENCRISDNNGYGVSLTGDCTHFRIDKSHIGGNASSGVIMNYTGGHEMAIKGNTIIHGNDGYGVDIVAGSNVGIITETSMIFNNTLGNIRDNGTDTYIGLLEKYNAISTGVWDALLANHAVVGSFGEKLAGLSDSAVSPADIVAIVDGVWDELVADHTTAGTFGKQVGDIDTSAIPTKEELATQVWAELEADNTVIGSMGVKLSSLPEDTITAQDIADMVDAMWDELVADHTTAGTFGKQVGDIDTSAIPTPPTVSEIVTGVWGEDLSTYGIDTAGKTLHQVLLDVTDLVDPTNSKLTTEEQTQLFNALTRNQFLALK